MLGGKTIVLKLLGLLAHMARAGIPIPVDPQRPRVDFFDPILADIGDLQSVGGDLSTFSGHMLVCREILRNARENSLVLCDELGSGTYVLLLIGTGSSNWQFNSRSCSMLKP